MDIAALDLAIRQLDDYRNVQPGTYFAEDHPPLTLDEAYLVQNHVAKLRVQRGERIVGYKIGCVGPIVQQQVALRGPIRGFLYESELRKSGDALAASDYANLAIEGEMAIVMGTNQTISSAFPIIELHNYIFRSEITSLQELVVNNGLNAGVVLPASGTIPIGLDTPGLLEVWINGELLDVGKMWHEALAPIEMLEWLSRNLARDGVTVQPGDLILCGTALGLYQVKPGDRIRVVANACVSVETTIVP
jgi:2-keto-4-pentenoate hydratase